LKFEGGYRQTAREDGPSRKRQRAVEGERKKRKAIPPNSAVRIVTDIKLEKALRTRQKLTKSRYGKSGEEIKFSDTRPAAKEQAWQSTRRKAV